MIEAARNLCRQPNTYWVNQLEQSDTITGYASLGEEIGARTIHDE